MPTNPLRGSGSTSRRHDRVEVAGQAEELAMSAVVPVASTLADAKPATPAVPISPRPATSEARRPSSVGSSCSEAPSAASTNKMLERRAGGGIRTLPAMVALVGAVAVAVALTSVLTMTDVAASSARREQIRDLRLAADSTSALIGTQLTSQLRIPVVAARELLMPTFRPRDAQYALALLARVMQACSLCERVVFALATGDEHHASLRHTASDEFVFAQPVNVTLVNGSTTVMCDRRTVLNMTTVQPVIGPRRELAPPYSVRREAWWPAISSASPVLGTYAPLRVDSDTGLGLVAGGAPAIVPAGYPGAGALVGVVAIDVTLAALESQIFAVLGNQRHTLVFEAGSGAVLFTSWGERGRRDAATGDVAMLTIDALQHVHAREVLSWFTVAELHGDASVEVSMFPPLLGEGLAARLAVVDSPGARLRVVVFADGHATQETLTRGVLIAASASFVVAALVAAGAVVIALLGFQRPLAGMAAHVNGRAMAALTGEESSDDDDSDSEFDGETRAEKAARRDPRGRGNKRGRDAQPALHELRVIGAAFDDLVAELRRVRAFIPDGAFGASLVLPTRLRRASAVCPAADEGASALAPVALGATSLEAPGTGGGSFASDLSSIRSPCAPLAVSPGRFEPHVHGNSGPGVGAASESHSGDDRHLSTSLHRVHAGSSDASGSTRRRMPEAPSALRQCNVTLAVLEFPGLAAAAAGLTPRGASVLVELVAEIVEAAAAAYLGAVEHFAGDRVVLSFNTLRASHSHRRLAVECCLAVHKAVRAIRGDPEIGRGPPTVRKADAGALPLRKRAYGTTRSGAVAGPQLLPWGICSGVASGVALVGTAGSAGLTRLCALAECRRGAERNLRICVEQSAPSANDAPLPSITASLTTAAAATAAAALQARGALSLLPVVCDAAGFVGEIQHSVTFQIIDAVGDRGARKAPALKIAAMRFLLDAPTSGPSPASDGNDGEWMYELQRAEAANEFADVNAAFVAFAAGNEAEARANLLKAQERPDAAAAAAGIARLQQLLECEASSDALLPRSP